MLSELARLTTLEEGSPQSFKVRAYENARAAIEASGRDVTQMSKAELMAIKRVGGATADTILEFVATGKVDKRERLRPAHPRACLQLPATPGPGQNARAWN